MSLREAAQAVINRWDSPLWKDVPATAEYINRLRVAIEQAEKCEPDGYIEIEIYDDVVDFGFAASFEQGVLDHIKDKVLRLIDEDITVPEMHVKPFYLHPPSATQIPQEWKDAVKLAIDATQKVIDMPRSAESIRLCTQVNSKLREVLK